MSDKIATLISRLCGFIEYHAACGRIPANEALAEVENVANVMRQTIAEHDRNDAQKAKELNDTLKWAILTAITAAPGRYTTSGDHNGLIACRHELPPCLHDLGRERMKRLVDSMVATGLIVRNTKRTSGREFGLLSVPS